jgi:hypothetical protein
VAARHYHEPTTQEIEAVTNGNSEVAELRAQIEELTRKLTQS